MKPTNKFSAKPTDCASGHRHASKLEAKRCDELTALEEAGTITHLTQQPVFPIRVNDVLVCKVLGDFQYRMADSGLVITEDAKGRDTPVSRLKRKLLHAAYPGVVMTLWPPVVKNKRKLAVKRAKV